MSAFYFESDWHGQRGIRKSHQELDRLEVLKLIESKRINQIQGAKQLNLSTRQVRRVQLNYPKDGAKGIQQNTEVKPATTNSTMNLS